MQLSLFLRATLATLCLSLAGRPYSVGLSVGVLESRCTSGSFRHAETGWCKPCTYTCPRPLVETTACQHNADTVCSPARDAGTTGIDTRSTKLCPFDSFLDRQTGMCKECTRFCHPPLVMTVPCRRRSDAVCSRPKDQPTERPGNSRGAISRRRKNKKERRRRKKTHRRTKGGASHSTAPHSPTSAQLCIGNGNQFYDLELGRCFPCRMCEAPEMEEHLPCLGTSDRVCRPAVHNAESSTVDQAGGAADIESNELPQDSRTKSIDRFHNNEYPDMRPHTNGERQPPVDTENTRPNSAAKRDQARPDSIHSNIAE